MTRRNKPAIDPEMLEFEAALLRSIDDGLRGEGRKTRPEQIEVRRRGRPVGSVKLAPKVATTIRFDQDVLVALKASGRGWQTRVNEAMREWLVLHSET
ncbi:MULTISPECIES: BrnA antitoxin family protein [unclassified Undibacterium]|uniref:BrnA antitoxin family protein n=1 Tax=unclassified Undibacterium TaxID=2630295 RepID=UPI002AC8A8D2|nr:MULTISPECIES: BrnA antitoxin family protein [unclassified Undibacterium]MEB0140434.1 BrnA antitoxin family protein [Undibacterium sp. CCC2.1]MEB0174303.1 BrnA antitoxin family protein [Undibacterium sp. CCC1.1]MEB0178246.1 BrnA antitoxin family protein [Undibacterium sp. CCC3.4]MEB0217445.1 BrnA antitoxin family protein [Undibacterium sp. 5I2]WPX44198.1 BrnA antitoxin family protein [Undibacterium sp. CCC3.4]